MTTIDKSIQRDYYDRFCRDKEIKKFYQSSQWRACRAMKLSRDPMCQACEQAGKAVVAVLVHHLFKITTPKGWHYRLDLDYLVSVCHACHNAIESEIEKEHASD